MALAVSILNRGCGIIDIDEDAEMKTFILLLGAQKCGTSWLYEYLKQSPRFGQGFSKEYHIWDALDIGILHGNRVDPVTLDALASDQKARQSQRFRMQNDEGYYFDYFTSLFTEDVTITADITPSYSGLKAERLHFIKQKFAERGVVVKPVFLIRDPLRRIKSSVRFNLDRRHYKAGIVDGETNFTRALGQYYCHEHCIIRTRYDEIHKNAVEVFGKDQIYVGLYESMFTPAEIVRLSHYLGVEPKPDFARVKVNKTRNVVEETELDEAIRAFYSEVYDYCFEQFPATRLLWSA